MTEDDATVSVVPDVLIVGAGLARLGCARRLYGWLCRSSSFGRRCKPACCVLLGSNLRSTTLGFGLL
jgi:hypothetical protein